MGFLSVKKWRIGKITGVKTEAKTKAKIKCQERPLKYEDCEAETPWCHGA